MRISVGDSVSASANAGVDDSYAACADALGIVNQLAAATNTSDTSRRHLLVVIVVFGIVDLTVIVHRRLQSG